MPEKGSASDMLARLKAALPARWFADSTPVLDGVLSGLSAVWNTIYLQLEAARKQARLATAEGGFLDMLALDYFAGRFRRLAGQGDVPFRLAIGRELLRERATRAGLVRAVRDLTGRTPWVFEPAQPRDTGSWGGGGVGGQRLAYGLAGGWGSLALPFQSLVVAYRPSGGGVADVGGYDLVPPGALYSPSTVTTRNTAATLFDDGGTLREIAAGVPRVNFAAGVGTILQEAASRNWLRNPRAEGVVAGVVGSGGARPTFWNMANTGPAGLSFTVVGPVSLRGVPGMRFRISGTPASSGPMSLAPEPNTTVTAATGETWTWSFYLALAAGTTANAVFNTRVISRTAGGAAAGGTPVQTSAAIVPQAAMARIVQISTLTGDATTAVVVPDLTMTFTAGQAVDFTLDLCGLQLEKRNGASSLILPPVGVPGAADRAAESTTLPVRRLGGYGTGAMEYVSAAMLQGQVTDANILSAITRSLPASAIAWTRIAA